MPSGQRVTPSMILHDLDRLFPKGSHPSFFQYKDQGGQYCLTSVEQCFHTWSNCLFAWTHDLVPDDVPEPVQKQRQCLRCDKSFLSYGPGHRLCTSCREYMNLNASEAPTYELRVSGRIIGGVHGEM